MPGIYDAGMLKIGGDITFKSVEEFIGNEFPLMLKVGIEPDQKNGCDSLNEDQSLLIL